MVEQKHEFVFHKFYEVTVDPSKIESPDNAGYHDEFLERLRRMVDAIIASPEALKTVITYQILAEVDAPIGGYDYVEAEFDRPMDFVDIIVQVSVCFHEEDRQWLLGIEQKYQDMRARYEQELAVLPRGRDLSDDEKDRIGYYRDQRYDFEEIANCFKVEPNGWSMHEIAKK